MTQGLSPTLSGLTSQRLIANAYPPVAGPAHGRASGEAQGETGLAFSGGLKQNGFYSLLGKIEGRPLLDTLIKEIVGINLFKILFTRSRDERIDVGISEIGNTVAFAAGGLAVDKSLATLFTRAAKGSLKPELARRWGVAGRSFALYSTIFSLLWAMPFVRNYVTSRRIGSDRFTDVIKSQKFAPSGPLGVQQEQAHLQQSLAHYKRQILAILGLGVSGALLSGALGFIGIRSTKTTGKALGEKFMARLFQPGKINWQKLLLLNDGKFANFAGVPALLFWGVPAYAGWIHASRDTYEKKEQLLKFANFTACFFGPPLLINKLYEKKFKPILGAGKPSYATIGKLAEGPLKQRALKLWAGKNGLGLLSSVVLLGTMPQLINIELTKRRLKRAQENNRVDIYKSALSRHVLNGQLTQTPSANSL